MFEPEVVEPVVHADAVPVPVTLQVTPPLRLVGAVAPGTPLTIAVKVRVPPFEPPPPELRTTEGVTCATVTATAAVAGRLK